MALAATNRGSATEQNADFSMIFSPSSNFTPGALAVIVVAADNGGGGGTASISNILDSAGNTWTIRQAPLYDPGAANAGVSGVIATSPMNVATLTTAHTITVSCNNSTTCKAAVLMEVTGLGTLSFVKGGNGTGAATTTPTVTSGSIANGNMIIGGLFNEHGNTPDISFNPQTVTGDGDTTNGSWSAQQTTGIGIGPAGITVASQRKVVTSAGAQTYNPTLSESSDVILAWIEISESGAASSPPPGIVNGGLAKPRLVNAGLARG